jgi:hypothetical protein
VSSAPIDSSISRARQQKYFLLLIIFAAQFRVMGESTFGAQCTKGKYMQRTFRKTYWRPLLALVVSVFTSFTIYAEGESVPVAQSNLTGVNLPTGAVRINQQHIPAGINQILEKIVAAGEGKLRQGGLEVLAWAGGNYKKAIAGKLVNQVQSNLQGIGWTYEVAEKEGDVTIFSVVRRNPTERAIIGFYVPTDDALVIAWTEILKADGYAAAETQKSASRPATSTNALLGTWDNGGMSLMGDRNRVTGSVTPSNGHTFKYVFSADGRFENIGMMQSTLYGCTTTLFNDKRGTYTINGNTLTLTPDKNFWRQQFSCAPNSNKERNHTLTPETFRWRTKTDEYGKAFICLTNDKGESCYRRAEK